MWLRLLGLSASLGFDQLKPSLRDIFQYLLRRMLVFILMHLSACAGAFQATFKRRFGASVPWEARAPNKGLEQELPGNLLPSETEAASYYV